LPGSGFVSYAILTTVGTRGLSGHAGMAKLADAADLKSAGPKGLWGFDSPSRHQLFSSIYAGFVHQFGLASFGTEGSKTEKGAVSGA
jgi:hypothetical protein